MTAQPDFDRDPRPLGHMPIELHPRGRVIFGMNELFQEPAEIAAGPIPPELAGVLIIVNATVCLIAHPDERWNTVEQCP